MNHSTKLLMFVLCCFTTKSLLPIIISTTILSKQLENGITQHIVLLGDRHMFLQQYNDSNIIKKIIELTAKEQDSVIACAKKFNALVIAEDVKNVHFTGLKASIKQWILKRILHKSDCSTYLSDLTKKCEEHSISCINAETRADAFISMDLINKTAFICSNIIFWAVYMKSQKKSEQLSQHMNTHLTKYLLAGTTPLVVTMAFLYDAYKQSVFSQKKVNGNRILKDHVQQAKDLYKKTFDVLLAPVLKFVGWQVDVEIIAALHNNPTSKYIFVCAGQMHTNIAKRFLEEQGYKQDAYWENKIALATNFSVVPLDDSIDVDSFIITNLSLHNQDEIASRP
ncbi:hypothetical protein KJZ61_02195 [Candidatus Dependentiae bacterium]|nr:hypothetical protein [Candidatus Dependentiae bacterium]